tara:strand:- start:1028 stop:1336 length:309 start_codon:yes stop_codon:yes gene_type:complete
MPTYTFWHKVDNYQYEEFMSMSELDEYKKNNPDVRQIYTPIAITGDHIMGVGPKTDGGFNENMQRIAAAHPDSPLASRYGSGETHAQIKTRNVVDKYRKKNK